MRQKASQHLYAYWNEIRRGRLAPQRLDIEPSRIGEYLADTFVLERIERRKYRYRLAGTRICSALGSELRNTDFLEGWSASDKAMIEQRLAVIADHGGVCVLAFQTGAEETSAAGIYEAIILPLVHTGGKVDRFVGTITPITQPSRRVAAGSSRLVLLHQETIWPDGKPFSAANEKSEKSNRHEPLLANVRSARLVKSDRRHFRVYDGGLAKQPPRR